MIAFIIGIAILIGAVLLIVKLTIDRSEVLAHFAKGNVIVYGKKGKGKDLLFQWAIKERHRPYYANITYGYDYTHIDMKDLELTPNTFQNFIKGEVVKVDPGKYPYEKKDIYFSEIGLLLPAQYDSLLHKLYPSLPISYALSRHLWQNNIHCNSQSLTRGWKALREQADYFIKARGVIKLPGLLVIKCTTYDKYESAEANLLPFATSLTNKDQTALARQFEATNGEIRNRWLIIRKKAVKYDTRHFKGVVFADTQVAPPVCSRGDLSLLALGSGTETENPGSSCETA